MRLSGHTVLVTGGASGIGLALASRFSSAGSNVIICGRREKKLGEARAAHPALHVRVSDLARESEREELARSLTREFPQLDVLVNNAGIQRRIRLNEPEPWQHTREEIAINLDAPLHLSALLIPHLRTQPHAAIVNVTSGLAFAPIAGVPIYCATKAALHSFTLSLRRQLEGTSIEVVEIVPPAVNTDLGGPGLHTFGVNVDEFADAVMHRIDAGEVEVGYEFGDHARNASRAELDAMFERMNKRP